MRTVTTRRRAAVLLCGALVLGSCGSDASDGPVGAEADTGSPGCGEGEVVEGRPLRVVTTVAPLVDLVATVATGSGADVTGIVPGGVDSHTFEPSPGDAATIEDADVVFLNGLGLETPTQRLAQANLAAGGEICELGTTVLPVDEYVFDRTFPRSSGWPNPHLWTSTRWTLEYVELIASVLGERDPANADVYARNAASFREQAAELDAAIVAAAATVPESQRLLLTYHDAYAYFADDLGWEVVEAIQPSSFSEPSPRDVAELIEQVDVLGVPAVFGSEVFPSPVLEQVAAATGAVYLADLSDDTLPGEPGDPEHTWFGLMRRNVSTIVEGLGGDAAVLRAG